MVGRDPIFAWALEQKIAGTGLYLEHVYTLEEARLRIDRFEYAAILIDGLSAEETELLSRVRSRGCTVIVLSDLSPEEEPVYVDAEPSSDYVVIPKESALPRVMSSLKSL